MSEQPTTSRDEGARLLQAGDPEGATSLLQQAIMQNPSDGRAHGLLGICHARRGDLPASIASLSEAARLMPNEAAVHYNLANVLFQAHRLPEARAGLERALALKPDHPGALQLLERVTAASPATAAPAASSAPPGAFTAAPPTDFSSGLSAPSPEAAPASLGGPPQPWSSVHHAAGPAAPVGHETPPPQGLLYTEQSQQAAPVQAPGLGRRLLRGWLWGGIYGQWWTLWTTISLFIWGGSRAPSGLGLALYIGFYFILNGIFGVLAGLVIAAIDADEGSGAMVGVGAGLLILLLEIAITRSPFQLINVFFYFFTGRFIGSGLARRVQEPVAG